MFSDKAEAHGIREFIAINDRLSALLTPAVGKRLIVQRLRYIVTAQVAAEIRQFKAKNVSLQV